MGIVILVRHGESESNVKDLLTSDYEGYPLTEKGRNQAKDASEQLKGIYVDSFLTSPVLRARETANIISDRLGIPPVIDDRIRESGMGKFNNTPMTSVPKLKRHELGMETWESHQKRILETIGDVKGVSLMVSHAFPIRAALAKFLDMNEEESYGINIRNATISVINLDEQDILCVGSRLMSERVKAAIAKGNRD